MPMSFFSLFLILGCVFGGATALISKKSDASRMPQSVAPTPASIGSYSFVSGTDDCPKEIEWRAECGGFTLNPEGSGESHDFCNINKGKKTRHEHVERGSKKRQVEVSRKENLISKTDITTYSDKGASVALETEDTVIIDETGKFLWEHSEEGKGYSCLYSR